MSGVVTATILSDGKALDAEHVLLSIDIEKEVNRTGLASVTLKDGDPTKGEFNISNSDFFEPGKEVEIKLRYENDKDLTVFKGIVLKQNLRSFSNTSELSVEVRDKAFKLTGKRKSFVFRDMKDSDIISGIISGGGLEEGEVSETKKMHPQMVQYYCSDWDFMLSRSDINGHIVINDDGVVSSLLPDLSGSPTHTFEYGGSGIIYSFEMESDLKDQYSKISAVSWDTKEQKLSSKVNADDFSLKQGKLDPGTISKKIGNEEYELVTDLFGGDDEVKSWADAKMIKDRLSMFRGSLSVKGDATVKLGFPIEIKGIGDKFNGNTIVTGIRHQITENGWITHIQFGLKNEWFSKKDIVKKPASGLLPSVDGLQTGVVDAFEEDPEGMFRVRVNIPFINEKEAIVWARLLSQDAGNKRGIFFVPEKGDEVILGFLNDDPRQAVILGGLYGKKNPPAESFKIEEKNSFKGLITREKLSLIFNDEEKSVEVSTPSGNKVTIKDEEGITLEDKSGNQLVLDKNGITVKSAKDVSIEGQNIIIKGQSVEIN